MVVYLEALEAMERRYESNLPWSCCCLFLLRGYAPRFLSLRFAALFTSSSLLLFVL